MSAEAEDAARVGPVLEAGDAAAAILAAIREENADVRLEDRGAYWRIGVPRRCRVTRAAIERNLGRAFRLPGDLELVMPSFAGRLILDSDAACWETGRS
jgi:toluene monooxygenase system protein D